MHNTRSSCTLLILSHCTRCYGKQTHSLDHHRWRYTSAFLSWLWFQALWPYQPIPDPWEVEWDNSPWCACCWLIETQQLTHSTHSQPHCPPANSSLLRFTPSSSTILLVLNPISRTEHYHPWCIHCWMPLDWVCDPNASVLSLSVLS